MEKKLQTSLPTLPGVYLFKNKHDHVIYIGKAKSLKNRVRSYFQKNSDWKINALMEDYAQLDYIVTHTEMEALLLEAQLIQEHKPKYNILLKTGQPFVYILFSSGDKPKMEMVRNKKKKGTYFGPFLHKIQARKVYKYLLHTFRLNLCNKKIENGCLDYHIGNCPGNCKSDFDNATYLFKLELAKDVLRKNHTSFKKNLKQKIQEYSNELAFEKAKKLNQYLENIEEIFYTIETKYSDKKYADDVFIATSERPYVSPLSKEVSKELQQLLQLPHAVHTIDCFDISHFQSKHIVGSCVRFTDGMPEKHKFRRFKIQTLEQQNDYAALQEIVSRRYKEGNDIPDLIVIDGGKGQLNAIRAILPNAPLISLAKREETIYSPNLKEGIRLDLQTDIGKLLIAIRDYAHHFAISYHRLRRQKSTKK